MRRPALELADVFRAADPATLAGLGARLSSEQRKAVRAILACRTAALGGHLDTYEPCGHEAPSYNSCRDRHCPKCQGAARERWLAARLGELLPTHYFHVVFTLPRQIGEIALRNKREVYGLLFRAAWETLRRIAADPRHLGAEAGMLAALHTWDQRLRHHPHLHCVVPGGGLSAGGARWVSSRGEFLVSVTVLSRLFRRLMLEALEEARAEGRLDFVGRIAPLALASEWRRMTATLRAAKWVVYAKRPFGGPGQVLAYLGRYTHKVAITNWRLVSHGGGLVRFRYRDRAAGDVEKTETLPEGEFLRRYLQHVLPRGFQRLRQYGLLANSRKREALARCRELLGAGAPEAIAPEAIAPEASREAATGDEPDEQTSDRRCPACGEGVLSRRVEIGPDDRLHGARRAASRGPPARLA